MRRRRFLRLVVGSAVVGAVGCVADAGDGNGSDPGADATASPDGGVQDATAAPADATTPGCDAQTVLVYDTYAQALYLDGSLGPLTGIITAVAIRDGVSLDMDFWHGHGGVLHRFTVTPGDFAALRRGERVYLDTTVVDDHQHTLFIDPSDPDYRVPDTEPVSVTIGDC